MERISIEDGAHHSEIGHCHLLRSDFKSSPENRSTITVIRETGSRDPNTSCTSRNPHKRCQRNNRIEYGITKTNTHKSTNKNNCLSQLNFNHRTDPRRNFHLRAPEEQLKRTRTHNFRIPLKLHGELAEGICATLRCFKRGTQHTHSRQ